MTSKIVSKRLLITGATGFIGRHLVKNLLTQEVELLAMGTSAPQLLTNSQAKRVTFLPCDFADADSIRYHHDVLQHIDSVVHVGGYFLRSSNPGEDNLMQSVKVNIEGTSHLLRYLPTTLSCFCYISTIDVYGQTVFVPVSENHPTRPASYYGVSKLATEGLLRVYSDRTGVPVTVLRLSQVYGPGDTSGKAIPNFIRAALRGEPPTIYGDGSDMRDYVYVDDVIDSVLSALTRQVTGTFNISGGKGHFLNEVVTTILQLLNSSLTPVYQPRALPASHIILDITRAREQLGYTPKITLAEGLRRAIAWFQDDQNAQH
ncbi:MAG TPA: SDR family NAD(P)-dependent oxidoreductase [Thermodesulfobacteriota bacterium]|nr:SDR family NAD(P)-dependent oxidoreductase [Thermodesulfobacteriota bacterium]